MKLQGLGPRAPRAAPSLSHGELDGCVLEGASGRAVKAPGRIRGARGGGAQSASLQASGAWATCNSGSLPPCFSCQKLGEETGTSGAELPSPAVFSCRPSALSYLWGTGRHGEAQGPAPSRGAWRGPTCMFPRPIREMNSGCDNMFLGFLIYVFSVSPTRYKLHEGRVLSPLL